MTDFVFPQDGDYGDAAEFASFLDHASMSSHVSYGLEFQNIDWANGEFDTTKGKAFLRASSEQGARSGETREGVVYEAFLDARTNVTLADDDGINYIYATFDVSTNDSASLYMTANQGDDPNGGPFVMIGTIDAGRQTTELLNRGPDITPEEVQFDGVLNDPSSPSLGTQWFREDEGIHYVELPGGQQTVPVAREFIVDDFESEDISGYDGNTSNWSFDANASEGSNALRSSIASGSTTIQNFGSTHAPQPGDTIKYDVLVGSNYVKTRLFYGMVSSSTVTNPVGYAVEINSNSDSIILYRVDDGSSFNGLQSKSVDMSSLEDEYLTVSIVWGEDGDHQVYVTDENGRRVTELNATDSTYTNPTGFALYNEQAGSGTPVVIYDNIRTVRPVDKHILDSQDTVFMGGEQTVFEGAVHTGPLNAPEDSKGVHTDQPVTDSPTAGDEVGYLFGVNAEDFLDVYAEADGSGGIQNERLFSNVPLGLADTNRQTLSGDLVLTEDDAQVQSIDPGGAARNVDLPAESNGLVFVIANRADAAEAITVRDDAGTSLATVNQDDVAYAVSDGTGWMVFSAAGGVS